MTDTTQDRSEHARANAQGWYETILAIVAAMECDYERLGELREEFAACETTEERRQWEEENGDELFILESERTVDGDVMDNADAARDRAQESALSVEVRSGWYEPGGDAGKPEEFRILLTTGGPALQLVGELDEHGQPTRAWLQYQDWGTPWTDFYAGEGSGDVLLTFAGAFWFGE